jgi:hypothetical protein
MTAKRAKGDYEQQRFFKSCMKKSKCIVFACANQGATILTTIEDAGLLIVDKFSSKKRCIRLF